MAFTFILLVFDFFLISKYFHSIKAATHWIVTEDGKIQTQDGSVFSLRRPYDLVALLEQEKRADALKTIKKQLLVQKKFIEATAETDGKERIQGANFISSGYDVEQVIYATNDDCTKAGKALPEFDLYVGTILFLPTIKSDSVSSVDSFDINVSKKATKLIDDRLRYLLSTHFDINLFLINIFYFSFLQR